jgi:hypothetical protein
MSVDPAPPADISLQISSSVEIGHACHAKAIARVIRSRPAAMIATPVARATRSPAGARRSAVIAAVTKAIVRKSITPTTRRIAVRLAQLRLQWSPRSIPCRKAVPAQAGSVESRRGVCRQQARYRNFHALNWSAPAIMTTPRALPGIEVVRAVVRGSCGPMPSQSDRCAETSYPSMELSLRQTLPRRAAFHEGS